MRVSYIDESGNQAELMITPRMMDRSTDTAPEGWSRYRFDGILPAGTISEVRSVVDIAASEPERTPVVFENIHINDLAWMQAADSG